jgi:hypothetical protein
MSFADPIWSQCPWVIIISLIYPGFINVFLRPLR